MKRSKKSIKVTIKKITKVNGYQIKYSLKKNMKSAKIKSFKSNTYTIKNVKNKKYYIQVRAYVIVKKKNRYGNWSNKKLIK